MCTRDVCWKEISFPFVPDGRGIEVQFNCAESRFEFTSDPSKFFVYLERRQGGDLRIGLSCKTLDYLAAICASEDSLEFVGPKQEQKHMSELSSLAFGNG